MYHTLLLYHSIFRWLVLLSLLYSIYRAGRGYAANRSFSKTDNAVRHWTATIAHAQLLVGIILYTQSPVVKYLLGHFKAAIQNQEAVFFGLAHIFLMLTAIVLITIASSLAKRKTTDREKFRIILVWYSLALALILIAIPWPCSPFANRPYFR